MVEHRVVVDVVHHDGDIGPVRQDRVHKYVERMHRRDAAAARVDRVDATVGAGLDFLTGQVWEPRPGRNQEVLGC